MISKDTLQRIRQCCVYMTSDSSVASYVSSTWEPVTARDVARIRSRMGANCFPNSKKIIPSIGAEIAPTGNDNLRKNAEQGSKDLLKALDRYWRKRGVPGPWMERVA